MRLSDYGLGLVSVRSRMLAAAAWNRLPETVRQAQTQPHFKKRLKHFYVKNFYDCDLFSDVVMFAVFICKWTLSHYDDNDDDDDDDD